MDTNKRAKLDMEIERALFRYVNKIKENVYDFAFLTVKRDPMLKEAVNVELLKKLLTIVQTGIHQGKGAFIGDFNNEIKTALDNYVAAENPTLSMAQKEEVVEASSTTKPQTTTTVASPVVAATTKPKVAFSLPSE
jgi:hypothetical protein